MRKGVLPGLVAVILVGWAGAGAAAADTPSWDIAHLMRERSEVGAERADFEEVRTLEMLSEPVQLQGTLVYRAPDYVRKTVTRPAREEFVIKGERITVTSGEGERTFRLGERPLLTGLAAAIRGTLAGNRQVLRRYFELALEGERADWSLRLTPRQKALREALEQITIHGAGATITRIETVETNGDRRVMRIH